ncbi:MAG: long-chain fatty acid--CoA ligase [Deltaproteobacteria bacterium HGW-Deltaproteobacteria-13]|jgi:long-chain acyl-CoA synthetase|nr:MAG: long-chain fatty acid--CoA ligase [Deltaproteobacteria bacterium HGW-Deltaproteobacteria-13]
MTKEKGTGTSIHLDAYYTKPNNLVDLFENSVAKFSSRNLFGTKNKETNQYEWITYGAVAERVNNLRGALNKLGLSKGEKVGVIVSNSVEWFVCANATHGLGGVFVPMYEKELQKVWQYIIKDAAIKYLFVRDQRIYDTIKSVQAEFPNLKEVFILFGEGENTLSALEKTGKANPVDSYKPHWSETAFIIYTSGTTGDPKGVLLHHGNMTHNAQECRETFNITVDDIGLSILPWAHSFGLTADLHCYILGGGSLGFAESADKLLVNFSEVKPTGMSAVPRVFNIIYDKIHLGVAADPVKKQFFDAACAEAVKNRGLIEKTKDFQDLDALVFCQIRNLFGGRLKHVVTGGAMMKPEIALFFSDVGVPTYDGYGLSETTPVITNNSPKRGNKYGTVGKVFKDTKVVIDKSRVGEDSMDGEIVVYGAQVMQGYHNKPEVTKEVMMPDTWNGFPGIRTGDRGWLDEEGYLHITGRFKDEYKLENGKYVHPESIENEMKLLRYISNVIVYGEGRMFNVALVVPNFETLKTDAHTAAWAQGTPEETLANKECTDFISQQITDHLRKSFGGYEIPQKFLYIAEDFSVDNGMLTQTLKLKRRIVMDKYGERLRALYDNV